jgi:type VI secretion system protein ImpG
MREELLEYYERELAYLRQLGAEFGQKYPRVASRLLLEPDRCEDPHVERLLEAFAFLAARVHLRMDDDFPELTSALFGIVYPQYLRPVPSMTVVECALDPEQGKQSAGLTIPAGTTLSTRRTVDGMACRFRTAYPLDLWPVSVAACDWRQPERLEHPVRLPGAAGVLRVRLQCGPDVLFSHLPMRRLRFYLSGETNTVHTLYELLCSKCSAIFARDPAQPAGRLLEIPRGGLQAAGFDESESLLPYPRRSFDGYRLLQEYFSFPEKFLFFTLDGLERLQQAGFGAETELLFFFSRFDRPDRQQVLEVGVTRETVRLQCTPAINLFQQTAEPILLTQTQHEYRILPDVRRQSAMEIFSIDDVLATNPSRRDVTPLQPLYAFRSQTISHGGGAFWHASRRYSLLGEREPSQMYLSLVDIEGELTDPNAEVLTVRCTCTNHDLPSRLPFGLADGDFAADAYPALTRITALRRPSASYDPPSGKGQLWRLLSQFSLNYLSLTEDGVAALQEILRLHNFTGSAHLDNQIAAIGTLSSQPHFALMQSAYGNTPARGTRVEVEFDERQFAGGSAYLFANVLDRFLGEFVSMNSFCQLFARTNLRKEPLGEWAPRAGAKALL